MGEKETVHKQYSLKEREREKNKERERYREIERDRETGGKNKVLRSPK